MVLKVITSVLAHIGPDSEYTWARLIHSALRAPTYHLYFELFLILGIVWLLFKRRYRINDTVKLTAEEKAELVREWTPDDLVPKDWVAPKNLLRQFHRCATGPVSKYVTFDSTTTNHPDSGDRLEPKDVRSHLNFASFNFLNFVGDKDLSEVAVRQMKLYGVGSCGPRGFYGTFDVHLKLEDTLSKFLRVEKAVVYSYGAATFSSAIPSYAKRTDVIFADEGIGYAAFQGIVASRSRAYFFRHNDMKHLEQLLMAQANKDREDPKRAMLTRRFFVVEGLYTNYGDMCPLPELVKLKYKHKVRILLDESHSFGVLGSTGRGATEYFGIDIEDIDMISGSLETALGVCGGFCAGTKYVVGHQELSGQGYCFSASLPPMLAAAATKALQKLEMPNEQGARNRRLSHLSRLMHRLFNEETSLGTQWELTGSEDSPIKHLRLRNNNTLEALESITRKAFEWSDPSGPPLLLTVARYVFSIV
ncbi:Serine palmitoyltransferase long chain base [Fasciola hepatica]|uniref:Serine palmitoyltransferase 1 n=1 Tax=Fasciola hepatica TaxID=6192 RepID=A0A2H1BU23_FASHE|nr:Serine palmitoyltransferase long chain base [Fasciola hepatica]